MAGRMSPRRSTSWPAGAPCWVDVTTPDVDAAQAFYAGLLGWTFGEGSPEYGGYRMAQVEGANAAGMAPAMEGQPPAWTLYFASPDAAASATAITENGGSLLSPVMPIGPGGVVGTMVVAADPTGAAFGVWQSGEHTGVDVFNEPGGLFWEDLRSTDADASRAFYGAVLGLEFRPVPMAGPDYSTFHHVGDEAPLGGIGGMMGMTGFPPHWIVYFGVPDVDAAVGYVEAHEGHVVSPGFDTPFGRMAAVTDPFGASFWIMAADGDRAEPDRTG